MNVLILLLLLSSAAALVGQTPDDDSEGWGPGEVGECVDIKELRVRLRTNSYFVAGNSLYHRIYNREHVRDSSIRPLCMRKIADLPIPVHAVEFDRDRSGAIIRMWSGDGEYRYHLRSREVLRTIDGAPLSSFLAHPIVSASVRHGSSGIFHEWMTQVSHSVVVLDADAPSLLDEVRPDKSVRRGERQIRDIDVDDLTWALRSVNLDPHRLPSLSDFRFDVGDLHAYQERLNVDAAELDSLGERKFFRHEYPFAPTADRRELFYSLPTLLDAVGPEVVAPALLAGRHARSSTNFEAYRVDLVNEIGDTLFCRFGTDGPDQPLNLPWTIRYGEAEFHTFNVELATLLMQLLPEDAGRSVREDRVNVLYAVAWYLGEVRMWQGEGTRSEE